MSQIIRQASLDAAFYSFNLIFKDALKQAPIWYPKIAKRMEMVGAEVRFPWMAPISGMREWIGPRVVDELSTRIQSIPARDFEKTIKIPRNAFLDDLIGLYADQPAQLAYQAAKYPDDLLIQALYANTTTGTYDGQFFFDVDHPVDIDAANSPVMSNLLLNTPLTPESYNAARIQMQGYIREDGRPMGIKPNILMVPPALEKTAKDIISGNVLAGLVKNVAGTENVAAVAIDNTTLRGSAEVFVVQELASHPQDWFLLDTSRGVYPFLFMDRQAPNMVALNGANDKNVFWDKEYIMGVDTRGNIGYGPWFLALRATGASS